jgi:hypothetical protein
VGAEAEGYTRSFFESIYPPDWDGGYDTPRALWREVLVSDAVVPAMAVPTASAFVRRIVTIAGWFFPRTPRAFGPDEVEAGLNHLRIEGSARRAAVKAELERLKATVAPEARLFAPRIAHSPSGIRSSTISKRPMS